MSEQQRYRVIEKLEAGGMAEVFRAESEGLQGFKKQVAIKRVLPHLSEKKKFIAMFLDEARISATLSHSNCVQVFDIGVGDNAFFIVMEFVDGANLKAIMETMKKQGREFPVSVATYLAYEICKGLSYAHELVDVNTGAPLHIVHRDMSPPNVLITKHGEVKIVDFGLAKASSQLEKSEPGIIKGKFSYLSPEAAVGAEVDARTDIFATGIILWELLSGQRLFLGESDFQTVRKVQLAQIPSISSVNPKVPAELERIVNKSLARDTADRYATARDFGQDLIRFLFSLGSPVSTFDIAHLVQGVIKEKQAQPRKPQGSIIDKLIEEALFEFTSLKPDDTSQSSDKGRQSNPGAVPLNPGQFVDPTNWANEIGLGDGHRPTSTQSAGHQLQEGNLAALEETEMRSAPPMGPPAAPLPPPASLRNPPPPSSGGHKPVHVPPAPRLQPLNATIQPAPKSSSAMLLAALFVLAAVLAGVAYMALWAKKH